MTAAQKKRILIVGHEEPARLVLCSLLQSWGHQTEQVALGAEALVTLSPQMDLLVVEDTMLDMDGCTLVQRIRREPDYALLPVLLISGRLSREKRLAAIRAGANGVLLQPVDEAELCVRVEALLRMKEAQDALARHQNVMRRHQDEQEEVLAERTSALQRALAEAAEAKQHIYEAHLDTIQRLAVAAEHRDSYTAAHIERVSHYCGLLAWALDLPTEEVEVVRQASRMHDVGKIGVPDSILLKESRLTPSERLVIQQHTVNGAEILAGSASPLLQAGTSIALSHHERWDGCGYPYGLAGEDIPLYGRICAVADVFDALTSRRPYKDPYPLEVACEMMVAACGTQFDPRILTLFMDNFAVVEAIRCRYQDEEVI